MTDLRFRPIYLVRPVDIAALQQLLARLSTGDSPRPLVFETRADDSGIAHLVGHAPSDTPKVERLLSDYFPDARLDDSPARHDTTSSGVVTAHPEGFALAHEAAEAATLALYGALAGRKAGEALVLQVVLGKGHSPALVETDIDPRRLNLLDAALRGTRPLSSDARRRLTERVSQPRIQCTIRIGVYAETSERRTALATELHGALRRLEAPGVHLHLTHEPRDRVAAAAMAGFSRRMVLSTRELAAMLGWPIGDVALPDIGSPYPRLLPIPRDLDQEVSFFARSTVGPEGGIGIRTEDRLQHMSVVGPTGSGKSLLLARLILDDLRAHRPALVIDPKRQLVDYIVEHAPAETAGRIVILDPAELEATVGFNPLDTTGRDPEVVADGVLAALKSFFADSWGPRTEILIQAAVQSLAHAGARRGLPYTVLDIPRMWTDEGFRHSVMHYLDGLDELLEAWDGFEALRDSERRAWIQPPLNKLRRITMRAGLRRVLGQARPVFRLRDLFRSDKVVLVPLNEALIGTGAAELLGSLIVAETWLAVQERAAEREPMSGPGFIYVDELQKFLHLPVAIEDALATSRSYGVGWVGAFQLRSQLPPSLLSALDGNARNQVVFAMPSEDARTLARSTTQLEAADFQGLQRFEIYLRVVSRGQQTDWFSGRTLPPDPPSGFGRAIREASRRAFGRADESPDVVDLGEVPSEPVGPEPSAPSSDAGLGEPGSGYRKARRS